MTLKLRDLLHGDVDETAPVDATSVNMSSRDVVQVLAEVAEVDRQEHPDAAPFAPRFGWFMMRQEPEFVSQSRRFAAKHIDAPVREREITDPERVALFWESVENIVLFTRDFASAAMPIWKSLAIEVSADDTAALVAMPGLDQTTADCVQAALLNTFNTSRGPINMQSAAFAIASFLHAHPHFKPAPTEDDYVRPYGNNTRYVLVNLPNL